MAFRDDPNPFKRYIDPACPPPEDIEPLTEIEWAWVVAFGVLFTAGVIVFFALGGCRMIAL